MHPERGRGNGRFVCSKSVHIACQMTGPDMGHNQFRDPGVQVVPHLVHVRDYLCPNGVLLIEFVINGWKKMEIVHETEHVDHLPAARLDRKMVRIVGLIRQTSPMIIPPVSEALKAQTHLTSIQEILPCLALAIREEHRKEMIVSSGNLR